MTQQWSRINANLSLSGDGLTATQGYSDSTYCPGYGAEAFVSGRYYWETTLSSSTSSPSHGLGIGAAGSSIANGQWLGIGAGTIGYFQGDGSVWNNGAKQATYQSYANGTVVCHALDVNHRQYWVRVGVSGNWNNSAANDPAANAGGFTVPLAVLAGGVVPAFNSFYAGDSVKAAFARSAWQGAAPAGYGPFDPSLGLPSAPVNLQIDAVTLAGSASAGMLSPPAIYRETDAIGDPAAPAALAGIDPLLGLQVFAAQLSEFAAGLQLVLAEMQARTALLQR
jgi:hypothetical protein